MSRLEEWTNVRKHDEENGVTQKQTNLNRMKKLHMPPEIITAIGQRTDEAAKANIMTMQPETNTRSISLATSLAVHVPDGTMTRAAPKFGQVGNPLYAHPTLARAWRC